MTREALAQARSAARMTTIAANRGPYRATCLRRSLLLLWLLRRRGITASIRFGVRRQERRIGSPCLGGMAGVRSSTTKPTCASVTRHWRSTSLRRRRACERHCRDSPPGRRPPRTGAPRTNAAGTEAARPARAKTLHRGTRGFGTHPLVAFVSTNGQPSSSSSPHQPSPPGFDGRLDNRKELAARLKLGILRQRCRVDSLPPTKSGGGLPQIPPWRFRLCPVGSQSQQPFCARDHFGVKPFYYHYSEPFLFSHPAPTPSSRPTGNWVRSTRPALPTI